jgi:hypothetical protein
MNDYGLQPFYPCGVSVVPSALRAGFNAVDFV